jgi:hypothetical protein
MDADLDLPAGLAGVRAVAGAVATTLGVAFLLSRRRIAVPLMGVTVGALDRLAETLLGFERWVVDAFVGAAVQGVLAAGWVADTVDSRVVGAPADAAARRLVRAADVLRPAVGGSLARVFWLFTAFVAAACVVHGLWPARRP